MRRSRRPLGEKALRFSLLPTISILILVHADTFYYVTLAGIPIGVELSSVFTTVKR